jgi:hypothetical protein
MIVFDLQNFFSLAMLEARDYGIYTQIIPRKKASFFFSKTHFFKVSLNLNKLLGASLV